MDDDFNNERKRPWPTVAALAGVLAPIAVRGVLVLLLVAVTALGLLPDAARDACLGAVLPHVLSGL